MSLKVLRNLINRVSENFFSLTDNVIKVERKRGTCPHQFVMALHAERWCNTVLFWKLVECNRVKEARRNGRWIPEWKWEGCLPCPYMQCLRWAWLSLDGGHGTWYEIVYSQVFTHKWKPYFFELAISLAVWWRKDGNSLQAYGNMIRHELES